MRDVKHSLKKGIMGICVCYVTQVVYNTWYALVGVGGGRILKAEGRIPRDEVIVRRADAREQREAVAWF